MVLGSAKMLRRTSQLLLIGISVIDLILCPHSKVEESFQLQATHDLYYYGILDDGSHYDHLKFPGVVPRTFTGPAILATLCRIITLILSPVFDLASHPLLVQSLARFLLLLFVLHAWFRLSNTVGGLHRGSYLLLVTAAQFHLPYYASRMLPNTFALAVVLHAYSEWFSNRIPRAAVLLVAATAIFRCDIILLLFTVGLSWLVRGDLRLLQAVQIGVLTGAVSLACTVPLDSWLWREWVWPEGQVFYYNTVLGKSSNWGVSPFHWYVTSALPKAMLLTALLVPLSVLRIPELLFGNRPGKKPEQPPIVVDTWMLPYLVPVAGFIGLYSCLGHKEMRFIFPAMPLLNLAAATGMERLHRVAFPETQKDGLPSRSPILSKLAWLAGVGLLSVTLCASLAFVAVSKQNYPGGVALQKLIAYTHSGGSNNLNKSSVSVYIDVASAMSGVSLFGQRAAPAGWQFGKAGYEEENRVVSYKKFTYLLSEENQIDGFRVIDVAAGHPRLDIRGLRVATQDAIYVHEQIN